MGGGDDRGWGWGEEKKKKENDKRNKKNKFCNVFITIMF